MQKILRINLASRNQALKRTRSKLFRQKKSEEKEYEQWLQVSSKKERKYVKDERLARREDFIAGPLAPDRDTGTVRGALGAMDPVLLQRKELPQYVRRGPKEAEFVRGRWVGVKEQEAWVGEGNEGNIVVGDRVCVVKGEDGVRGRIGVVKEMESEKGEVLVADVNVADVELPAYVNPKQSMGKKFNTMEVPIPISDVRLVCRVKLDGIDQDIIIKNLRGGAPHLDPGWGSSRPWHTRYIAGTEQKVDWPEAEVLDYQKEEIDMGRADVDEGGGYYVQSVYDFPLPEGVEDELVAKYSKKRTMHEEGYMARKIVEDARSKWYEGRRLVSPRVEASEKSRVKRKHDLSEEEVWDLVKKEMEATKNKQQQQAQKSVMDGEVLQAASRQQTSMSAH